ncbi:MAG: exosortase O [Chloroflexi bacterium]|nr:exosortase O [Chloroflexota bacterium]
MNSDKTLSKLSMFTPASPPQPWRQFGLNSLILLVWLWLYQPVFAYFNIIFRREDFRTNQVVLFGVLLMIALQLHKEKTRPQFAAVPHLNWLALSLVFGSSALYLLAERYLNVNMLSASLFVLGSYGLLGLWLSPMRWRQGLPAMLLLIGVLPFGEHLQTFVGYPMRIFTAEIVRNGLATAGVTAVGVDTILVFENSVSQVDLPCSGVKSLWTGMLFLIAATWVEQRPLTPRWLLVVIIFIPLLFIANLTRVAILVIAGQVMGWQLLAEMLHIPLGVLGFIVACATVLLLLCWLTPGIKEQNMRTKNPHSPFPIPHSPKWLPAFLIITLLIMIQLYTPRPQTGLTSVPPTWNFPQKLQAELLPLKPDENEWLTKDGAEAADRLRFQWGDVSGTMILITSKTWRAHHRPERCFEVYGLSLDDSRTHLVNTHFPVRQVALGDGDQRSLYSATYWFQSPAQATDDYASRIWADVSWERERWVLVSILFDGTVNPNEPEIEGLYVALHDAVNGYLTP